MTTLAFLASITLAAAAATGPLTEAERADLQGKTCEPFVTAFKEAAATVKPTEGKPPDEQMAAAIESMKRPESMKAADWARCSSLFKRELVSFKTKSIEIEAKVVLKSFATAFQSNYAEKNELCPSSKKPVPADLKLVKTGPWTSTAADWSGDPAWECVYPPAGERQRFQYEIKTNAKAGTFELIARGYPAGDGTLVTFTLPGKVADGGIEVGELQRK